MCKRITAVMQPSTRFGSRCRHSTNILRILGAAEMVTDMGCNLQVTPQQSLALVEYIAHLSVQDWTAVTSDLQRLGAHPPGTCKCSTHLIFCPLWCRIIAGTALK